MEAGLIYKLKVNRKTPIGYILTSNDSEVFLQGMTVFRFQTNMNHIFCP